MPDPLTGKPPDIFCQSPIHWRGFIYIYIANSKTYRLLTLILICYFQALINACATKPVVKLLINRHNNKYSYTGASDDNLLKNIELFDKLSLRFSNRVLFIKDVIGSNEICCWSFYGHGKKIAEVCCTAIVYATDRKNTKVCEFH